MEKGLISVIIPVYNTGKYIKRCLESIQNQTYKKLEIIVVNDGSTDNTADIVERMADKDRRITLINQSNSGVTFARNSGIAAATGEYIGFVDSDDEIEPEMYEVLYNNAIKYNADISHCGYKKLYPGRVIEVYGTGEIRIQNTNEGVLDLLRANKVGCSLCTKIYKKQLFESFFINKQVKHNEDLLMNFYLFMNSRVSVFFDNTYYIYNCRDDSATERKKSENDIRDIMYVADRMVKESRGNKVIYECAKTRRIGTYIRLYNGIASDKQSADLTDEIRKVIVRGAEGVKLSRNNKIRAVGIKHVPALYNIFQSFYEKNISARRKYHGV